MMQAACAITFRNLVLLACFGTCTSKLKQAFFGVSRPRRQRLPHSVLTVLTSEEIYNENKTNLQRVKHRGVGVRQRTLR